MANSITLARPNRNATECSADVSPSWYRMACQVVAQISVGTQNRVRSDMPACITRRA